MDARRSAPRLRDSPLLDVESEAKFSAFEADFGDQLVDASSVANTAVNANAAINSNANPGLSATPLATANDADLLGELLYVTAKFITCKSRGADSV